jgi:hypothetical protein
MQGSSYAVIGVLGVVCVMVLLFVLTANGISEDKQAIARSQAETAQAKKQAEQLAPYGNFIQVKEQRVASVKQLATGRIDWERLARGLAHLLPENVWLLSANASATGDSEGGGSASQSAPPPPPAPATPAPGGGGSASSPPPADSGEPAKSPSMTLIGCAARHPDVAVTLLRLRHLPQVEDVELASIEKPETKTDTSAGAAGGSAAAGSDCGTIKKKNAYKWEVKVSFKPQAGSTPETSPKPKVPAALGGGA